jgi:hypothetical protein
MEGEQRFGEKIMRGGENYAKLRMLENLRILASQMNIRAVFNKVGEHRRINIKFKS